jgi:hypothetical protein
MPRGLARDPSGDYMNTETSTITIHVAAHGCDGWPGDVEHPLATLSGARDRLRLARAAGRLTGPAEVLVHAGVYALQEPLTFGPQDFGAQDTPVTFRSAGDGEVRLLGGATLTGFQPHTSHILKLRLAQIGLAGRRFDQLFYNGVRQPMARYPNVDPQDPIGGGWLYVEGEPPNMYEPGHGQRDRFICHDPRLAAWSRIGQVELFIYPRYNWCNNIVRLKSYDPASGEVVLQRPATYEIYPGDRFYFRNVREELDAPGEWYLDSAEDTLYFWPPGTLEGAVISVPIIPEIIRVEGENDPAQGYLTLRGFTLEGCAGSGVVMHNACHCALVGCTVRNTGLIGVDVVGGTHNTVEGCDIYHTGATGIHCLGGERSTYNGVYSSCHHHIHNNYIHHVGDIIKSVPGILVGSEGGPGAVGVTVSHNLIHDGPRWGIFSRGNDNVIEYNHIRHVNTETSDTSAIDMCDRDWTMRGTIIRYNHIHDILGYHREGRRYISPAFAFGIYLDDWTSGVHVYGNLTYRTPWGGFYINSGQDNVVENNCFLNAADHLVYFHRWPDDAMEVRHVGTHGLGLRRNLFRGNILAGGGDATAVYAFGACLNPEGTLDVASNRWEHNLIWRDGQPLKVQADGHSFVLDWDAWQALGFDADSVIADPQFVDAAHDDFHLRPDSPAPRMGFTPLPIEQMGPLASEGRATWPIVEAEGIREHPIQLK